MSFTLYLMRHAKSDWTDSNNSDFERPINDRGERSAIAIGQWLTDNDHIPQYIISSAAVRAKQTTEIMTATFAEATPEQIIYEQDLYLADVKTLLRFIQTYKTALSSLMIVAHNPGMEELVEYLLSRSAQPNNSITSMTTANVAIFEYLDSEFEGNLATGKLVHLLKPSEIS